MKQKMTGRQKVGFFVAGLLPALWLLCGLFIWILGGSVPTLSFILTYLLARCCPASSAAYHPQQ